MSSLLHPTATNIQEADVIRNQAYPLLRELIYHYDVQVLGYGIALRPDNIDRNQLMLGWKGIPVAYINYTAEKQFAFRNVMSPKDRGRSHEDRYTYYATKVSSLMRTIKKFNLMPESVEDLLNAQFRSTFHKIPMKVAHSFKGRTKNRQLNGDDTHELLQIVFNNKEVHSLSQESIGKYKTLLDIYDEVDKVRQAQAETLKEIFSKPVWAIGHDKAKALLVGKLKFNFKLDADYDATDINFTVEEPFVRSHDVDHISELIPRLTMLKVHMQQNHEELCKAFGFVGESQLIPRKLDMFIPPLNVCGGNDDTWGSLADTRWLFVL